LTFACLNSATPEIYSKAAGLNMKSIHTVRAELEALLRQMEEAQLKQAASIRQVHPDKYLSAANLIDYLVFRSQNLKELQEALHCYGFSSLASSESHIRTQLCNVMALIDAAQDRLNATEYTIAHQKLVFNSRQLFGADVPESVPYIMVTLDGKLATDFAYVVDLMVHGMNIARINCAHDNEKTWLLMVEHVRRAAVELDMPCKVYMDLAGPKIRTRLLGKAADEGRMELEEGELIWLLEEEITPRKKEKSLQCTLHGVVGMLQKGQRVLFDDGMFAAVVTSLEAGRASLTVTRVSGKKPYLKAEKGMNFPDTTFNIDALTPYDLQCLPWVAAHADMLGFSFVNKAADIAQLQKALTDLGKPHFPIIAKIETNEAVKQLASIVLQGMQKEHFGVMIARGDLAVEIGFERLSEIQEEILWICEAAHVPVIWATQVLESLNKQGIATRSEVTDAARAAFAECVMINKGKYTREVLISLVDILARSRQHNHKQRHIFRELSIARQFFGQGV
jgi:pyruvate kinase